MDTINLSADLTFKTALEQREQLHRFIQKTESNNAVIDLSAVTRSDSAGLALMVDALRLGHQFKKRIVFAHIPEQMKSMMSFCNVLSLFIEKI